MRRRLLLVVSMILLVLAAWFAILGPLWLFTSRTYRAPLDLESMRYYEANIDRMVAPRVKVYIPNSQQFPDLAQAVEKIANENLARSSSYRLEVTGDSSQKTDDHITMTIHQAKEVLFAISDTEKDIDMTYTLELVDLGELPSMVSLVLLNHVLGSEIAFFSNHATLAHHVAPYSPAYHLTFSLVYGGGDEIQWDIKESMHRFGALVQKLDDSVANITIDSQVEYYAELGTSPQNNGTHHVLDKDNLSTLVNFAEWSLASTVEYQTLNFVLYIPSPYQSPLVIADSSTNSFLIPQWGGVTIMNTMQHHLTSQDLDPVFDVFASQLLSLLGAPTSPSSPAIRMDMLSRMTTLRALRSTAASLGALVRLYNHMPNIAIPKRVLKHSEAAIEGIKASLHALSSSEWAKAASLAGQAFTNAEQAFFDKEMVAQTFVPSEHMFAVYMPLLGPIALVLFTNFLSYKKLRRLSEQSKKALAEADALAAETKLQVQNELEKT